MRVFVESVLPCDAERAWAEVQKCALLMEVARPLVVFRPAHGESLPERWIAGMTVRCRSYLFGLIPLVERTLFFDRVDRELLVIETREHDWLVRRWDHIIRVQPLDAGRCRYSDEVEIDAGLLTPAVWLFAYLFYKHRQRRWHTVAKRLQAGHLG
jgi:hypothetical protein